MSFYGIMKCDGGTRSPDFGGRSYSGGGMGSYSGGSGGRRDDELLRPIELKDGGASYTPVYHGGYSGGRVGSSSSSGNPICCIGLIVVIIAGLVLNFIFHLELWLIAVILVIMLVVFWIAAAILD
jgi:hypothetical protein